MDPQSGNWIGTFTTDGGTAVYITLELTFTDGAITGSFRIAPQTGGVWKGPRNGELGGRYTANREIYMNEQSGQDSAAFTGIYSASGDSQVIQGNVVIERGDKQQIGTLVVYSSQREELLREISAHLWDP